VESRRARTLGDADKTYLIEGSGVIIRKRTPKSGENPNCNLPITRRILGIRCGEIWSHIRLSCYPIVLKEKT
jgi:hypothetical protein